jgi:hypothetical protein
MNTTRHLTPVLMIAATLAAAFSVRHAEAAEPAKAVVTLPRVEIVASRKALMAETPVVQLPRVVVIGKRLPADEPTRLAQKAAAPASRS